MLYDVVTVGDAVLDTQVQIDDASVECNLDTHECKLCLNYAGKIPITSSFQALGGNAANVVVGLKKLGLNSAIVTTLGADSNGKIILTGLEKANVDTSLVKIDKNVDTRYAVVLNYKGERTILSYHAPRSYVWPKKMETTWLYFTNLSEGFEQFQAEALDYVKRHPTVKLVYNPGSYQLKNALPAVREFAAASQILIVNLEEAEQIANLTLAQAKSVPAIIHALLETGCQEVAITDAAKGAWAGNEENIYKIASFPVKVVSKTGAGDAFSSGYLAARMKDHDLATALSWGIATSCSVIGAVGAQTALPDEKELSAMLNKYTDIRAVEV